MTLMQAQVAAVTYRTCFECGTVWTRRSLVRAFRREVRAHWTNPSFGPVPLRDHALAWWSALTARAGRIGFCQECLHDW